MSQSAQISPLRPSLLHTPSLLLLLLRRFALPNPLCLPPRNAERPGILRFRKRLNFQALAVGNSVSMGSLGFGSGGMEETGVSDLPVELCMTYDLPPALTFKEGMDRIKGAIGKLKSDPPCCRSGVVRFQVRVPPSIRASALVCSEHNPTEVFPQFYITVRNNEDGSIDVASLDGMLGVSGVGSAVYFHGCSHTPKMDSLIRYLSVDSPLIRAYGFVGINHDKELSSAKHDDGSFYIFIPQIELDGFEDSSILASTVIWDDCLSQTFKEAIHFVELSLYQVAHSGLPASKFCNDKWFPDINRQSNIIEGKDVEMVYLTAEKLTRGETRAISSQLEQYKHCFLSFFRLSATHAFSANMMTCSQGPSFSVNHCPNINAVWASIVVEECVRLGLTYFCIAPGSRSSPLAISAATHPLTTCISCIDERALAFHAVGYAKGSYRPAVVITSSGTAVSNLLPAVVEASYDFVPLLLLTADRPSEMQDVGANQSINQVDHFGKFVRFFFSLPSPSDEIPARMVLTTIDSAIYKAIQAPSGPVHINCPFREPLADHPSEWTLNCLQGLENWMTHAKPFTTYINLLNLCACDEHSGQLYEVVQIIQRAERGLLLLGAINTEDEIWAALLLAKHLSWPVIADILSGLRLRKVLGSLPQIDNQLVFLDHLDHALLSDSVRTCARPDVVLQLGGRITSKRVTQLLEFCSPASYIFVDKHPYRHDPSHLVTHRIQSTITVFAKTLLKIPFTGKLTKWNSFLQAIDMMVSWELSLQIRLEDSLTEPHVAHIIASELQGNTVLFIGNSMVIRDVDMYGRGWIEPISDLVHRMSGQIFPYQGIRVAGNRGASGIDGLLSSAVGFAVGCNKRVLCMIGDVSFLHDTNGLAILKKRTQRKPMTILVINNHGGAIFSLLPIAERTQSNILQEFFYTSHDIKISKLCSAHSIKYLNVRTKVELQHALSKSQQSHEDCIIEVESSIADNSSFHSILRKSACQAANQAVNTLLLAPDCVLDYVSDSRINKLKYSFYRIQLSAPPTTPISNQGNIFYREGFVIMLTLDDGSTGFGEVAPLEVNKEDLQEVEEQLRFLLHVIEGSEISCLFTLLKGTFSSWIWRALGVMPSSLFPSVRCGIEMVVLNALANKQHSDLSDVTHGSGSPLLGMWPHSGENEDRNVQRSTSVQICALVDCKGTPVEVAHVVSKLVSEGFTTIKLKVGRRANPVEDAAVIQEIRNSVGSQINIRVDANRIWTYEEAVLFGSSVKYCSLQYVEEPVQFEDDIIKFCEETCIPVALDETITNLKGDPINKLKKFVHPGIAAIVIRPSFIGGFEKAALLARWAQKHEKMAIISSAFESSLSLYAYIQFAHYLECQKVLHCKIRTEVSSTVAHGLGTYKWLKEDLAVKPLGNCIHSHDGTRVVAVEQAVLNLHHFQINDKAIQRSYSGEQARTHWSTVDCEDFSCTIRLLEMNMNVEKKVIVFLHGFLGTGEEWVPMMKAFSANTRCISIDIPGHGQSQIRWKEENGVHKESCFSVESMGDILHNLICDMTVGSVVLVGYSMGARIALNMSLKYKHKIEGAILISGSPGLRDDSLRRIRVAQDDAKARYLLEHGVQCFLDVWYSSKLWNSLRDHPLFERIVKSRKNHHDINAVAKSLSDLSIGRQQSLWEDLKQCQKPLLLIVGEKDKKFKDIAHQMCDEIADTEVEGDNSSGKLCCIVEVPECGHAVHLENPLAVINAVSKFLRKVHVE